MPISMYEICVPPCIHALKNLATILEKGAAHAEVRKIEPAVLVGARLYPDMFPLARQVQIASDVAKAGAARLAGIEPPSYADDEASFPELLARVGKTVAFLESIKPVQLDGSESRTIKWKIRDRDFSMPGQSYLSGWVLPNLYFHVTTAYDILRHNGVELGKGDYLGRS